VIEGDVKTGFEMSWKRLLLAVSAGAVPPAFFLSAISFTAGRNTTQSIGLVATILTGSWLLMLAGVPLLGVVVNRWSGVHLQKAYYLLGAITVLLLPLVSVTAVIYGAPMFIPTAKVGVAVPVTACLSAGLLAQPYGWLAGWAVWRLGFPNAAVRDTGRFSRSWSNLGKARLVLSLCLLTLLPVAAYLAGLLYFSVRGGEVGPSSTLLMKLAALIESTALILATIGGAGFLYASSRGRHGRVSLASCLTVGCGIVLLLPFAFNVVIAIVSTLSPAVSSAAWGGFTGEDLSFCLNVGTVLTPLGLPGGWLLWQIGIAPAPRSPSLDSDIPTFD
jgi:hypothetical protein